MKLRTLITTLVALILLAGCASLPTNTAQVQKVRQVIDKALTAADTGVGIAGETGKLIAALPIDDTLKSEYDCAIVTVFGTQTPAGPNAIARCGAIPLASESPFTKGLDVLERATTCPSAQSAASVLLTLVNPVIQKLETSPRPEIAFAGASFRVSLSYIANISTGAVPCQ